MIYQEDLKNFLKANRIHVLRNAIYPVALIDNRIRIVVSLHAQQNQEILEFLRSKNASSFRLYKIQGKRVRFAYL